ncbi:DinB family protein [Metabacillus sp. 84]|uniref:DinB family protein n=1 Tax=Metabacillus sp. 84 TaxID=3404705 RepID=UPI003CEE305B
MNELMAKQFTMTRGWFLKIASETKDTADVQPKGFRNTIRWHIGHTLTTAELLLFHPPAIPSEYKDWFGGGTSPENWPQDVPSSDALISRLSEQLPRILTIPDEELMEKMEKPFFEMETAGELAAFVLTHEALHMGKIEEMKRVIDFQKL